MNKIHHAKVTLYWNKNKSYQYSEGKELNPINGMGLYVGPGQSIFIYIERIAGAKDPSTVEFESFI
jgi:hypothetical protein